MSNSRDRILNLSLFLEYYSGSVLAELLNIPDKSESKSFGRTSQALSFNSKINLLLDMFVFDKKDVAFINSFMFIRNQFMHNIEVDCILSAFDGNSGEKNKLENVIGIKVLPDNDNEVLKKLESMTKPLIDKCNASLKEKFKKASFEEILAITLKYIAQSKTKKPIVTPSYLS